MCQNSIVVVVDNYIVHSCDVVGGEESVEKEEYGTFINALDDDYSLVSRD